MRTLLVAGLIGGTLAAAVAVALHGSDYRNEIFTDADAATAASGVATPARSRVAGTTSIAGLPDRGNLAVYLAEAPHKRGASTMHAVQLSEAHALASVHGGAMVLRAPNGERIDLAYADKIEHGDGNWTWVGHPAGTPEGAQAVITFGEKAVFGRIPQRNGEPLEIASVKGRTFIVETDARLLSGQVADRDVDALALPLNLSSMGAAMPSSTAVAAGAVTATPAPAASAARTSVARTSAAPKSAALVKSAAPLTPANMTVSPLQTIDLALGYTAHYAERLGGASQALTRITFLVDLANRTLANTGAGGHFRLVRTLQVAYPDATLNRTALTELTGVTCTNVDGPTRTEFPDNSVNCTRTATVAALQPLVAAREQSGADLAVLLRTFEDPEQQSCGIGWMLGGGQQPLDAFNAAFGFSVVSDSSAGMFPDPDTNNTCRSEQLAHELGHNLGLQHELAVAQESTDIDGDGNLLDPEEFGRYAYSFGYNEPAGAGNFYTVMAQRFTGGQSVLIYSNPRSSMCGVPCGNGTQADQARTIAQTLPMVAAFRQPVHATAGAWPRGDFDGDGRADVLFRNLASGQNVVWKSGNSSTQQAVSAVGDLAWTIAGAADFNGDGRGDILWRNNLTGANTIWRSGLSTQPQAVTTVASQNWYIAGAGDFDGDGKADILWRNALSGANAAWRSGSSVTPIAMGSVADSDWNIVGVGDFNGDNRDDILWRNSRTGANLYWRSGVSTQVTSLAAAPVAWFVAGVADFDGDGKADVLFRNSSGGQNAIWKSGLATTPQAVATVADKAYAVAGVGDFDRDGKADILWRHGLNGKNVIWRSGNAAAPIAVTSVTNLSWTISG